MFSPEACRDVGGRVENSAVRGQISDDLLVHSGSMDQGSAGIWTAQVDSQTGRPMSDRLPLMGLKTISPSDLKQLVLDNQVTTIDVNSRQSWLNAHVPGAVNLDPVRYTAGDLPSDKHSRLVFYCSNSMCTKAPNAARRARKMGYENIRVMSAGITGWQAHKLPTQSGG